MPRGPTAYFLFTAENRSAVQEELKSKATSENEKISVAAISKAIGEKWRSLSDEEKQRYKDLAAEKAAEISKDLNGESEAADSIPKTSTPLTTILPISLVKKIAFRDEEVGRISADGIRMIAESCGLFLGLLAAKSYKHAVTSKRKNFKFSDIEHVAKKDKRMCDMGLPMSFEIEEEFVLLRNKRNTESNTAKPKDATNRSGTKTKTLNSFFAPKPSADA